MSDVELVNSLPSHMSLDDENDNEIYSTQLHNHINKKRYGLLLLILFIFILILTLILYKLLNKSHNVPPSTCSIKYRGVAYAYTRKGLCSIQFADQLQNPRGMIISNKTNDILIINGGAVWSLWDDDGDMYASIEHERMQLTSNLQLNHGIVIANGFLYASSVTNVYRWLIPNSNTWTRYALSSEQIVISSIPSGGHSTRTLVYDNIIDALLISIGSASNVDADYSRSGIKILYNISTISLPISWSNIPWYAYGLRNEVGLRFDHRGVLFGVENGVDNLYRSDLGGDIHNNNPAEELNNFGRPQDMTVPQFYGYPQCWSEFKLTNGLGVGTQYVHNNFMNNYNDSWCRSNAVIKPVLSMPAHVAPLDIFFSPYNFSVAGINIHDALVTFHGSWNRDPPQGYSVVHIPFQNDTPIDKLTQILRYNNDHLATDAGWIRPVSLAFKHFTQNSLNCLLVTDNGQNTLVALCEEDI